MRDERREAGGGLREAFSLLSDDTRLTIIQELMEYDPEQDPPSYTELKEAVGARDSGRFNYHLEKLRGNYVRKDGDGYVPLAPARAVYRTVLAHRPTETIDREEFPDAGECCHCGASLTGYFYNEYFNVACRACETHAFGHPFPKAGLEGRSDREVLAAVDRYARRRTELALDGVCPVCAGDTDVEWVFDAADAHEVMPTVPCVGVHCDTCSSGLQLGVIEVLTVDRWCDQRLARAGVVSELKTSYIWETARSGDTVAVRSRDPPRVAAEIPTDSGACAVVLGEEATVIEIRPPERLTGTVHQD